MNDKRLVHDTSVLRNIIQHELDMLTKKYPDFTFDIRVETDTFHQVGIKSKVFHNVKVEAKTNGD